MLAFAAKVNYVGYIVSKKVIIAPDQSNVHISKSTVAGVTGQTSVEEIPADTTAIALQCLPI